MDIVGPHIYHYLHHPLLSSGEPMLYYTLDHLVHTGAIGYEHRRTQLGHGEHHLVDRLFLYRIADPGTLPPPEAAALSLIPEGKEYSLSDLRHEINHTYPNDHYKVFKSESMQEYLTQQGLLSTPSFTTPDGRKKYREVHHLLNQVEHDEEQLLNDHAQLQARLDELGSNVVLLHHSLFAKLKDLPDLDERTKTILILQTYLESGGYYHEKRMG
ncbi:MAG TPA: hypothetical protein PKD45_03845 [Flavobacteriales bacterium]|nr:hypothetical protein [Flavobacteriales bacterium]